MRTTFAILAASFALSFPVTAQDIIQGETGEWTSYWHGVGGDRETSLANLPRACPVVARALNAAQDGDFSSFCSCFWEVDTNHPPARVRALYDEWRICLRQYIYSIGQEAVLTTAEKSVPTNGSSAVSVVPSGLKPPKLDYTDMRVLKAEVVFARQVGTNWKLLPDVLDQKIEQAMLDRAAVIFYEPRPKEPVNYEFRRARLEGMRKNGASIEEILSAKESYQAEDAGVLLKGWKRWTNYYNAVVLDPPVAFEMRDPVPTNFTDPVSAFRSYSHALFCGDASALLKYADASGKAQLKSAVGVDEAVKKDYYVGWTNKLTHITVLLTAGTKLEGRDYSLVFWRAENEHDPTNGAIALQSTIFVVEDGEYLLTHNLWRSTLADIFAAAKAIRVGRLTGWWLYPDFEEIMHRSDFPPAFYDIH